MKLLSSLCLICICFVLLPDSSQALDSKAGQQLAAGTVEQSSSLPRLGTDYSPTQRLQAYFRQISRQKLTDSLGLEAGSLDLKHSRNLQDTALPSQAFYLSLPLRIKGLRLSPYFLQSWHGSSSSLDITSRVQGFSTDWPLGHAPGFEDPSLQESWWLGTSYALELFQPFSLQGNMLKAKILQKGLREQSWLMDLKLSYSTDVATPNLWARYSKSELGGVSEKAPDLPRPLRNLDFTPGLQQGKSLQGLFGPGLAGYSLVQALAEQESQGYFATGSWQVGIGIRDISFLRRLEHSLNITYGKGTYEQGSSREYMQGLSKEDSFIEARIGQRYRLYENLAAIMELGYASLDLDPEIWGEKTEESAYLMSFGLNYEF